MTWSENRPILIGFDSRHLLGTLVNKGKEKAYRKNAVGLFFTLYTDFTQISI